MEITEKDARKLLRNGDLNMIGYCDSCQKTTEVRMLDIDHYICEECCGAGWDNLTRLYYAGEPYKDWHSLRNEIIFYSVILIILGVLWFYFG